jgi:hypothetical protein
MERIMPTVEEILGSNAVIGIGSKRGPKDNLVATTDPGVGDDSADGYAVGSMWVNNSNGAVWEAVAVTLGTAQWRLLNSYVGNWTPDPQFGGANTGMAFTVRGGSYCKGDRFCFVKGKFVFSNKGTAVGVAQVKGLPFLSDGVAAGGAIGYMSNFTGLTGTLVLGLNVAATDAVSIPQSTATGFSPITDTAFTNTSRMDFSLLYSTTN